MHHIVQETQFATIFSNERIFEGLFANVALEVLPDVGIYVGRLLAVSFTLEPLFQTTEANIVHRAGTFARTDQFVFRKFFLRQTNTTNSIFGVFPTRQILFSFHLRILDLLFKLVVLVLIAVEGVVFAGV